MSERKAHNPRSFCRTYTMDKQLINTGEQKDMTEFFTDLISKLEDMSPSLVLMLYLYNIMFLTHEIESLDTFFNYNLTFWPFIMNSSKLH